MYILDMKKLKSGDIILSAQISAVSKAVCLATKSDFSHAILYVGYGSFIHSDSLGVHSNNIQRLLFEKEKYVEVFRLLDDRYVINACMFACTQIGKSYSIKDAINTQTPFQKENTSNRQFCSRLVAQAYDYAGIRLVNNINYCTPKDLQVSKFTKTILGCTSVATDEEIQFANSPSPIQRQSEITNSILSDVRKLSGVDIQSLEELDQFIIDNPSHDVEIATIVQKSGYLNMWDFEAIQNPWRYDRELFMSVDAETSHKKEIAEFELNSAIDQVKLYSHNYLMCRNIRSHYNLRFIEMKMELFKNLINLMNKRIEAAKYVIKNT